MTGPEYELLIDERLVLVRWRRPTASAAERLLAQLLDHAEFLGARLVFAILVGPDCPPPDAGTRAALFQGYVGLHDHCQEVRMVLFGEGFGRAVMRSVITAMVFAAGLRSQIFQVDPSVAALLDAAARASGRELDPLREQVVRAGLLSAAELDG